jgi:hypothetical protein
MKILKLEGNENLASLAEKLNALHLEHNDGIRVDGGERLYARREIDAILATLRELAKDKYVEFGFCGKNIKDLSEYVDDHTIVSISNFD